MKITKIIATLALVAVVGCGVDGAPIMPSANVGVSIGPNGITPTVGVKVKQGPVTVNAGPGGNTAAVTF